jgi:hypothetical protein
MGWRWQEYKAPAGATALLARHASVAQVLVDSWTEILIAHVDPKLPTKRPTRVKGRALLAVQPEDIVGRRKGCEDPRFSRDAGMGFGERPAERWARHDAVGGQVGKREK